MPGGGKKREGDEKDRAFEKNKASNGNPLSVSGKGHPSLQRGEKGRKRGPKRAPLGHKLSVPVNEHNGRLIRVFLVIAFRK